MHGLLRRRPSASMAVACLALFVALGGVGYAAVTINGKNIKNGTITGKKLKGNTLTGRQINEGRLGSVPAAARATTAASADNATNAVNAQNAANATNAANAANATNAANAANAASLNGAQVRRIDFRRTPDNQTTTILDNFFGLTIQATCESGGGQNLVAFAENDSSSRAAIRLTRVLSTLEADGSNVVQQNQDSDVPPGGGFVELSDNNTGNAVVTLVYSTEAGAHVTVVVNITENPFQAGTNDCLIGGTATGLGA